MSAIAVIMHDVYKDQEVDWNLQPAICQGWTSRQDVAYAVSYIKPSYFLTSIRSLCISSHLFFSHSPRQGANGWPLRDNLPASKKS